ncbi:hypothetical protein BS17DRAFT_711393, partial [Gyrodon lividus]
LYDDKISVFNSASSRFYAPSDLSGIASMHTEHIRACPQWHNKSACYDCVFINTDMESGQSGMQGLEIAQVFCFFSFTL